MKFYSICSISILLLCGKANSQNIGVGRDVPAEKIDVNGKLKANGIIVNYGGAINDFLVKSNAAGEVGFKKPAGAVAVNYIICIIGNFPSRTEPPVSPFLGEIQVFSGGFAPAGWAICNGETLQIAQNTALFSVLGTTYGGNGQSTFKLPDLRGAAAIGTGASPGGYDWGNGQRSY